MQEDLFCTSAAALMIDTFGTEFTGWEPETVELEMKAQGIPLISNILKDRIMCASTLLGTDMFNNSYQAWSNMCRVLNGSMASGDFAIPPALEDVLWGCTEAKLMTDDQNFSPDIASYVGSLLSQYGIAKPPVVLSFALMDPRETEDRDMSLSRDEFAFKIFWDNHNEAMKDLEAFTRERLLKLVAQLRILPLKNGTVDFLKDIVA